VGAETCDGRDNSCDGVADNGCPTGLGGLASFDYTSPEYGAGSGTSTNASCPAGQVVRGVFGRVNGSFVTQINVICGTPQINEDRTVTPYRYSATVIGATDVGVVGSSIGGTVFRHQCPGDSVVTRIRGRTSTYLYQFGVECSTLSVTGNPGALRVTATPAASSPGFGSTSGTAFEYGCPANTAGSASVLRGLYGRPYIRLSLYSTSVGARCGVPSVTVR
jgi:hypothetical protein